MTRNSETKKPFCLALIEESDLAHSLHLLLQNQGILPGIAFGTRTVNEPVTSGERAFIMASTKKAWNDGYTPLKVINFSGKKEGD